MGCGRGGSKKLKWREPSCADIYMERIYFRGSTWIYARGNSVGPRSFCVLCMSARNKLQGGANGHLFCISTGGGERPSERSASVTMPDAFGKFATNAKWLYDSNFGICFHFRQCVTCYACSDSVRHVGCHHVKRTSNPFRVTRSARCMKEHRSRVVSMQLTSRANTTLTRAHGVFCDPRIVFAWSSVLFLKNSHLIDSLLSSIQPWWRRNTSRKRKSLDQENRNQPY